MRSDRLPRVLVPREGDEGLEAALRAGGAEPVPVPLIARVRHPEAVRALLADHPDFDLLLLTSATTAEVLAEAAPEHWVPSGRVAAVGTSTTRSARSFGLRVDATGAGTGAALIETLGLVPGSRVLYPRAAEATPATLEALQAAGCVVHEADAYRNLPPPGWRETLRAALPLELALLLSGSGAERLREGLGTEAPPVAVIGPSTEAMARSLGLRVVAAAEATTAEALARAALRWLGAR